MGEADDPLNDLSDDVLSRLGGSDLDPGDLQLSGLWPGLAGLSPGDLQAAAAGDFSQPPGDHQTLPPPPPLGSEGGEASYGSMDLGVRIVWDALFFSIIAVAMCGNAIVLWIVAGKQDTSVCLHTVGTYYVGTLLPYSSTY